MKSSLTGGSRLVDQNGTTIPIPHSATEQLSEIQEHERTLIDSVMVLSAALKIAAVRQDGRKNDDVLRCIKEYLHADTNFKRSIGAGPAEDVRP